MSRLFGGLSYAFAWWVGSALRERIGRRPHSEQGGGAATEQPLDMKRSRGNHGVVLRRAVCIRAGPQI